MRGQGRRRWRKRVTLIAVATMLIGQGSVASVWAEEAQTLETFELVEEEKIVEVKMAEEPGVVAVDAETTETVEESEVVTAEETAGTVEESETVEIEEETEQMVDESEDLMVEGSQETVEESVTEGAADTEISEQPTISEDTMEPETTQESASEEEIIGAGEQMETYAANNIASGKSGDITWVIDANGKLTVEGVGELDWFHWTEDFAWRPYSDQIISAEVNVSGMTNASYLFYKCTNMTHVDVSNFDTSKVTDMSYMFYDCSSLTSLNVRGFDTSNVKYMHDMFAGCSSLTSLDVSGFDTSKVTNMSGMFYDCGSLASMDVSNFDTENVIYMSGMFAWCMNLKNIDESSFNTSNVESMDQMFFCCCDSEYLDVSGFDTRNVTSMSFMFAGCDRLKSLDVSGFNTEKVTDMSFMFRGCVGLTSLDVSNFNTSNVTYMAWMFQECVGLTSLDLSNFDTSRVTRISDPAGQYPDSPGMGNMFTDCTSLKSIKTPYAMGTESAELPDTFIDSNGTETRIMSKEFCNNILTRKINFYPVKFTVVGIIGGRNVTFNNDTEDAVIYYSSKTSNLTTNDACVKPGETVLFENFYGTIYAKAYANGQWSNVSRLILKIPVVNKPTITSKDGVVTIKTTTPDSYIYYTTDGSTPSPTNGTRLAKSGGSFTVPANCTVKAIAVRSCFSNSEIASASVAAKKLGAPSFVVKGVIGGREVTFNTTETKGEIYYSFTTSNITTKDLHVKPGEKVLFQNYYGTVYARTYVNGQWSNVSRLILKIPVVNKPTITAAGNGKVKISTSTPDCAIYYTTDGSTPSPTNGTRINASSSIVTVGSGKTVKAIAVRSCFTNSDVVSYRQ